MTILIRTVDHDCGFGRFEVRPDGTIFLPWIRTSPFSKSRPSDPCQDRATLIKIARPFRFMSC